MNVIKFRVWDKYSKRMRYLGHDHHDSISFHKECQATYYNLQCGDGGAECHEKDNEDYGFSPLMQYTTVKDKTGQEIYVGDIVACRYKDKLGNLIIDETCQVVFQEGCFAVTYGKDITPFRSFTNYEFEIIGNIYENPESLK